MRLVALFLDDEGAASAVEYGLLVALIALGSIMAFEGLGDGLFNLFGTSQDGAGGKMEDAAITAAG